MSLTINHQLNDIINSTGTITINGVAAGGDNTPIVWFGSRGVFGGGKNGSGTLFNTIDYITIATTGNATDFGDLTGTNRMAGAACSNGTRGVFGGGGNSFFGITVHNILDYVTIATTGNAADFGDLTVARMGLAACSNGTRGVFGGGTTGSVSNVMDYITISTAGNAIDFGDLTSSRTGVAACSNESRGVFGGGNTASATYVNTMDYITISTTGNAADFGDLTVIRQDCGACSSAVRGLFAGGYSGLSPPTSNVIEYITIATTGNATDFGDLTAPVNVAIGGTSNGTRGVFTKVPATAYNAIDYVTISTPGNAADFGDLSVGRYGSAACSGT